MWSKKKQQQAIFDEMADRVCIHSQRTMGVSLPQDEHVFVQKIVNFVKKVKNGGFIIDAGCGTGALLNNVKKNMLGIQNYNMIGIDISAQSLKSAKKDNATADFIVCDMDALPLRDKSCDLIIIRNVLHHLTTLAPLGNLIRLLDSNGFLLIDDKIKGNPIQGILSFIFPLMPFSFKMILRERDDHIDKFGRLPPIRKRRPREYLNSIDNYSGNLHILEITYHGFFLFLNIYELLSFIFPRLSRIQIQIYWLHSIEKRSLFRWSAISMTIVAESA
jgi:ubiquinone/menaquinone biosynthesis C-methylase UbiE